MPTFRSGIFSGAILAAIWAAQPRTQPPPANAPLPGAEEIKQRVIANEKKSEQQKERYLCIVNDETAELQSDGQIKKQETKESEEFYLNGQQIDHLLVKNGKPLKGHDADKEQARVSKEVKKFSDPKQVKKAEDEEQKEIDLFLKALRYTNGHRQIRNGRSTVVYDLSGDPAFHASNLEQRFAKAIAGRIWVDEETGELLEMRVHTDRDVKIAGGLLANLHKGFQLHAEQSRQPDGVWLTSLVEGTGDARAGLFFHPRFQFKETTGQCRLYSVDATSQTAKPADPVK
ncbi:MAG: hypothetical protein WAM39_10595 [Bryobacteraceae bacterium]